MEVIHLPKSRKQDVQSGSYRKKVRTALNKSTSGDHAAVCLLGDSSYVVHLISDEKVYAARIAYAVVENNLLGSGDEELEDDLDPSCTFIAIAPKREASTFLENRLVSVLFVKNGHIVESRDGRLTDELNTYIAQQAATVYNGTIVRFAGLHINALEDIAQLMNIALSWVDVEPTDFEMPQGFFEERPVNELLSAYKESTALKLTKLGCLVALICGGIAGYNLYNAESAPTETHVVVDEFKQHREALSGVHASEHFYRLIEVIDVYYDKHGWAVASIKGSQGGKYKAIVAPSVDGIATPVTPFLLWARDNTENPLDLVDDNRLSFEGSFKPVNYLERFHPFLSDLALNIAQIKDVTSALGASGMKFGKVQKVGNFKKLTFTIAFRSVTLHELAKLYEALERVPVVSKDIEIRDLKDGTFAVTHIMEFIGN